MELKRPFLLFLGDAADDLTVKTAAGIVDWRKSWCVGQWRLSECKADVHLDDMSPSDAKAQGAETMIVGVANAAASSRKAGSAASLRRWRPDSMSPPASM